jgi:hypothetical protein
MTLVNMSQTAMPLLFGALGSALGMAPVFWATAILLLGGGLVAKRNHDRRVRAASRAGGANL